MCTILHGCIDEVLHGQYKLHGYRNLVEEAQKSGNTYDDSVDRPLLDTFDQCMVPFSIPSPPDPLLKVGKQRRSYK